MVDRRSLPNTLFSWLPWSLKGAGLFPSVHSAAALVPSGVGNHLLTIQNQRRMVQASRERQQSMWQATSLMNRVGAHDLFQEWPLKNDQVSTDDTR